MTNTQRTVETCQPKIDVTVPHSARIWNYWLGGKDNFAADRAMGEQISAILPDIAPTARAARAFLGRVVTYLAGEVGVRQFLDIGTGLPRPHISAQRAERLVWERFADLNPAIADRVPLDNRHEALRRVLGRVWVGREFHDLPTSGVISQAPTRPGKR